MRRAIVAVLLLAGGASCSSCSSFELELDVYRGDAPDAEVRIDGAPVGAIYRATFDDYDDAKRAGTRVEVLHGGAVTDTWDDVVAGCDDACNAGGGTAGCAADVISAKLDVIVQTDYAIDKVPEGRCGLDDGTVLVFAP